MSKTVNDTKKVTPRGIQKISTFDKFSADTVFVSNLPQKTLTKEIWAFFKRLGEIKHVILPKKRD